ncbi:killer toxin [Lasiosphaeria ovina]|uniref:Killer toxin n=1 Tax=Lasiosphaeria ovina TaxID=92902 RepID=A0AAE0K2S8_9PEZI|nr:killer toxin [Lasiosphaeria ovina]
MFAKFSQLGLWAAILSLAGVNALGINCLGSSQCGSGKSADLQAVLETLPDEQVFLDDVQIACVFGGVCAFLQNIPAGEGVTGAQIKSLGQQIVDHGCQSCGSVPFQNNDVSEGELTFNFSNTVCGDGDLICPT